MIRLDVKKQNCLISQKNLEVLNYKRMGSLQHDLHLEVKPTVLRLKGF